MANDQEFNIKLLKFIAAEIDLTVLMYASREIFGQSLFALSQQQRKELREKVHEFVAPAFGALTEENLTPRSGGEPVPGLVQ